MPRASAVPAAGSTRAADPTSGGAAMAMGQPIRNPIEWSLDQLKNAELAVETTGRALRGAEETGSEPVIRSVGVADLRDALARGIRDLAVSRTDVLFVCLVYPLAGLLLAWFAFG